MIRFFKPVPLDDLKAAKRKLFFSALLFAASCGFFLLFEFMYYKNFFDLQNVPYYKDHTVPAFCYAIDNAPLLMTLAWAAGKMFNTFDMKWGTYFCSFIVDMCAVAIYFVYKNPSDYSSDETHIVCISAGATLVKAVLFIYKPRFRNMPIT